MTIKHRFVDFIPDVLEDGVLYITLEYCTAIHKCVCGCGNEVVTPISPSDWQLTFDGKSVSLRPSIGNWNFDCRSHYFITNNRIRLSREWTSTKIDSGRKEDMKRKKKYYKTRKIK